MDDETRENLKEFSKHIQGVGRMIGSTKSDVESLIAMRDCLTMGAETLDIYIKLEIDRINEVLKEKA